MAMRAEEEAEVNGSIISSEKLKLMTILIIRFFNILMAGLITGAMFGILVGYNPHNLSSQTYVEQQQSVIKALNNLMPLLGLVTIILTIISAILQKGNQTILITLLTAAVLLVVSGLVTRFGNQPINSIVMTWNKAQVPDNWVYLRNKWWSFHIIRTSVAFLAFCLIVWTCMQKD
jgi:hypothetical protein